MFKTIFQFLIVLFFMRPGESKAAYGFPDCKTSHCSQYSQQINSACIAAGMSGKPFPVVGPAGETCTCPCSCVVEGTRLTLEDFSEHPIEYINTNSYVFNPYTQKYQTQISNKTMSTVENFPVSEIEFSNGSKVKVSDNHTFVTKSRKITNAKRLNIGDTVTDQDGEEAVVLNKSVHSYTGNLHNVVVNPKSEVVSDHIVSFNKVLSGDLLVQDVNDRIKNDIELRMNIIKPLKLETEVNK